jgi:hypothetical protein
MDKHREAALEIIHKYYYTLPNNGYLNSGINSCESRYKEAIECALICVERIISTLEFISIELDDPAIMGRINAYDGIQNELHKIKSSRNKMTLDEFPTVLNKK